MTELSFRCPACGSQMNVSATACPICLRPRSRQEMLRDLQGVKRAKKRMRRSLLLTVATVAAVASFALHPEWWVLIRNQVAPAVAPVAARAKESVAETVKANWPETAKEGQAPVTPVTAFNAAINPESSAPKPASPPNPAPTSAAPAPEAPAAEKTAQARWTVEGSIYNLLDLKPAAGVDVVFAPTSGDATRKVRAGKDGKYRASLPILSPGGGYRISIVKRGRNLPYLEEATLPYRDRSQLQREDAVAEATQAPVLHAPLSPEGPETRQDFALLPDR